MFSPKISVVLSSKNGMPFLPEAVDSILNQSFTEFELLLLDDGSTDDTKSYMDGINDSRVVRIYNGCNLGIDGSRNKAFAMARAPYIAPMDADDFAMEDRLAQQYDFMENNPDVLASGGAISIYETGEILKYPTMPTAVKYCTLFNAPIAHPASIFRRKEVFEITGGYPPNLSPTEDYGLWALLLMSGKGELANIEKILLRYRTHPSRDRGNYHQIMESQADKVREQLCKWFWGRAFDDAKLSAHLLASRNQILSLQEILSILKYFSELLNRNNYSKLMPHDSFFEEICNHWEQISHCLSKKLLCYAIINFSRLFRGIEHQLAFKMEKILWRIFLQRTKKFCRRHFLEKI